MLPKPYLRQVPLTAIPPPLEHYEESRPSKKPNPPPRREHLKFLVQILDLEHTKESLVRKPFASATSWPINCEIKLESWAVKFKFIKVYQKPSI